MFAVGVDFGPDVTFSIAFIHGYVTCIRLIFGILVVCIL
ncbi:hypothetical protein APY04_3501 [Hyphomicrobium sulfonivorans]|uniref:Uncharacterized protein n=1 Tax=Hyphomicrobium sulfonivorans TaxID=121290 RepID=A0A109B932_HYPSL|nr:hypothetical protein APY04_3501 [Hyphomicrobium sulfonivorans]